MFGISSFELLIIFMIGLLVLGPERMPEVVRGLGKVVGKLKRFTDEARSQFEKELEVDELKKTFDDFKKSEELRSLTSGLTQLETEAKKGVGTLQEELSSHIDETTERITSLRPILTTPPTGFNPRKESLVKEPLFNVGSPPPSPSPFKKEPVSMDDLLSQTRTPSKLAEPYTKSIQSTVRAHSTKAQKEDATDWQVIVNQRQLEILVQRDQSAKAYYNHIKEKYQRKLLTEEERQKRYTERMTHLNKPR